LPNGNTTSKTIAKWQQTPGEVPKQKLQNIAETTYNM
jgi:hypothetical protein